MTHKSQLDDSLYKNWVKGGLASKYLKEGIGHMIDNGLVSIQRTFLSDICNNLTLTKAKCTDCTTANCLPCPTRGICNITGKGRDRKCSYHVKGDALKEHRKCSNDICDSLYTKILSQHRYSRPAWQNTDATKWCTDHWEIAKCFLPGSGYADKTSVEDTDCSGLLNLAINCLDVQTHMDLYLDPPSGKFSQILIFRNKIFHSAALSLTTEDLEEYIDLMISVLQDKKELEKDTQALNAVFKLEQLKEEGFFISTKDESEIRQESIVQFQQEVKDDYLEKKQDLQFSLCRMYAEHFNTIPISPLLEDIEAEIDDVFVELVLCDETKYTTNDCEYRRQNGRKVENYKDIFYNSKVKCKNIYVMGAAGMGKSTMCMKMLRNWVSAHTKNKTSHTKEEPEKKLKPDNFKQRPDSVTYQQQEQNERKYHHTLEYLENEKSQKKLKSDTLIQKQSTEIVTLNSDENVMAKYDVVLFVALRHAEEDGNIREMIRNQLFQECPHLDDFTTQVLEKEPDKCLIIVDGLDEWTRPVNVKCSSLLQHPSLPGRKGLNGCSILTTTRPWKLHDIRLQKKDIDKTINIQGIEDSELLSKKILSYKSKASESDETAINRTFKRFKIDVKNAFKENNSYFTCGFNISFLTVPLILIFIVCSWFDNGRLEKTLAGNFNGLIECLISAAETDGRTRKKGRLFDMDGLESLKIEWSKSKHLLPNCLRENAYCSAYSELLLKLGKLACDHLFGSKFVTLLFTESQLLTYLTKPELEVAVKIGILSQSKVVGKTLTSMSSVSFLHKTLQEYLAAVYLSSSALDKLEALGKYNEYCSTQKRMFELEDVLVFVIGMNLSTANDMLKHCAKQRWGFNKRWFGKIRKLKREIRNTEVRKVFSYRLFRAEMRITHYKEVVGLKIQKNFILHLCNQIPEHCKEDNEVTDIRNTMSWCPEAPDIPAAYELGITHLRRTHLLRVNTQVSMEKQKLKIDLSHCKHLENVNFEGLCGVQIVLDHNNLKGITLVKSTDSDINVIKTLTTCDSPVKELDTITMKSVNNVKLSLPAVLWQIDEMTLFCCEEFVIEIDPVDTSSASIHKVRIFQNSGETKLEGVRVVSETELKMGTYMIVQTSTYDPPFGNTDDQYDTDDYADYADYDGDY